MTLHPQSRAFLDTLVQSPFGPLGESYGEVRATARALALESTDRIGLDHVSEGALAICGFGWRGEAMVTMELDPAGEVWRLEEAAEGFPE